MEAAPLRLLPPLAQSGRGARCLPVCLLRCQVNHKTLTVIGGQLLASLTWEQRAPQSEDMTRLVPKHKSKFA